MLQMYVDLYVKCWLWRIKGCMRGRNLLCQFLHTAYNDLLPVFQSRHDKYECQFIYLIQSCRLKTLWIKCKQHYFLYIYIYCKKWLVNINSLGTAHPFWVIYSIGVTHINKNKNWKVKSIFWMSISKIIRTNTDILNFAKI